jgi:hypothetical protein
VAVIEPLVEAVIEPLLASVSPLVETQTYCFPEPALTGSAQAKLWLLPMFQVKLTGSWL